MANRLQLSLGYIIKIKKYTVSTSRIVIGCELSYVHINIWFRVCIKNIIIYQILWIDESYYEGFIFVIVYEGDY